MWIHLLQQESCEQEVHNLIKTFQFCNIFLKRMLDVKMLVVNALFVQCMYSF